MIARRMLAAGAAATLALALAGPVAAAGPTLQTWSNAVDVPYLDCPAGFTVDGVWTVSHELKTWFRADGTPIRDIEQMSFAGAFINEATGASIADAGKVIYFDTLAPDFSYVSTNANILRRSDYFQVAGRAKADGSFRGVDRFDVNIPAACAALGG
jgi:hypothetical protein